MIDNKLAIVIPYYKIDFFENCLASVASQTDKRFTLYIGNDASPNDPKELIDKYFPDGNYYYFDYKKNLGGKNLASQWERILKNISEEWFQILGDDDIISENFVEEFYNVENIIDEKINLIRVKNIYFNDKLEVYKEGINYPTISYTLKLFEDKLFYKTISTLSENVFRKNIYHLKGLKLYPIAWHSDDMLILELSNFSRYYYNANANVKIYNGNINLSSNKKNVTEKFKSSQLFFEDLLNHYNKYLTKYLINRFINNLYIEAKENSLIFEKKIIFSLFKKGYFSEAYKIFKMNKFLSKK